MKKLIIQIPCYNEEETLGITLSSLPRELPNVDCVEWLIVNDGSTDRTLEVAKSHGVTHIVNFTHNKGLAKAFMTGIEASLIAGADIIVNTDADNQYCADDIPKLIEPILEGKAEIVIGERPINQIKHFSKTKKLLQKFGSWVVKVVSNTNIRDAPSGFRAINREAAKKLNIFSKHTYTLEMIIQAGIKGIAITTVPIRTNEELRPSRLIKSVNSYVFNSAITIIRIFMTYNPLKFFFTLGTIPIMFGTILGVRWILLFMGGPQASHLPSLILSALLILIGFQLWMFGLVADLMSVNRQILEDVQLRLRQSELDSKKT